MGCSTQNQSGSLQLFLQNQALSYSAHDKISSLSFLEATRKYFYANTLQGLKFHLSERNIAEVIPKVCLLLSSSHLLGSICLLL